MRSATRRTAANRTTTCGTTAMRIATMETEDDQHEDSHQEDNQAGDSHQKSYEEDNHWGTISSRATRSIAGTIIQLSVGQPSGEQRSIKHFAAAFKEAVSRDCLEDAIV
jgi:hypothetical protein